MLVQLVQAEQAVAVLVEEQLRTYKLQQEQLIRVVLAVAAVTTLHQLH
jgi:hypothetical protein